MDEVKAVGEAIVEKAEGAAAAVSETLHATANDPEVHPAAKTAAQATITAGETAIAAAHKGGEMAGEAYEAVKEAVLGIADEAEDAVETAKED